MDFLYNLKRLLSYIYPILLETHHSEISGVLELSLQDGKLVLDSKFANYSYGSLHEVFQKVIKELKFRPKQKNALILGFGAGSIATILNKENKQGLDIDGVELDPVILDLYQEHFTFQAPGKVQIYQDDALAYLKRSDKKYDYIFIDVFENLSVPESLLNEEFIVLLQAHSFPHTQIAMNTMLKEDDEFVELWLESFGKHAKFKHYDLSNLVLFG